jgi:hypothetical protein
VSITAPVIIPVVASISVSGRDYVGIAEGFISMISPLLAAIASMTRIVSVLLIILFVVASWLWLSHVVFSISLAIGDFHEFSDGLRLLAAEFFDIGFSPNAVAESVDCPVDGDIFGSVQKLSEAPDVCSHRFPWLLVALTQFLNSDGSLVCGLEVLDEGIDQVFPGSDGSFRQAS